MRRKIGLLLLILCLVALSGSFAPRVSGNDDEKKTCEVHHIPLIAGKAWITYGLPELPVGPYYKAKAKKFPNSNFEVNGGCVVDLTNPEKIKMEADVLYCPKCRIAEDKWWTKHPRK
jgi:hypothetical protein